MTGARPWVICQIGAREHYVLAGALHAGGRLRRLVTDVWAPPGSPWARLPGGQGRRLRERHAPSIPNSRVTHFTCSSVAFAIRARLVGRAEDWPLIMDRNAWFQRRAVRAMMRPGMLEGAPSVFSYSYAALEIFRLAKDTGCSAVLGQIDPGPVEEDIVAQACAAHADLAPRFARAPAEYWRLWREECGLADVIVVNSPWSRDCLVKAGIAAGKIAVVPLAYEPETLPSPRAAVERFDKDRPLKVLFLGSLVVRKGVAEVLKAARLLRDAPVEFHLVGRPGIDIPEADLANPQLKVHGPVSRAQVHNYFESADVFLLPTLSDGFALALLEARAHSLPLIASRYCGEVVRDDENGQVLETVSGPALAAAIGRYLDDPAALARHGAGAADDLARFAPSAVVRQLEAALC